MPTYEYECEACGLTFERGQAITDPPLTECPECRGNIRRLVSGGAGFILKNAGSSKSPQHGGSCSLEHSGRTCCGREERCGKPPCNTPS
ncbi:MAG: zinc ribbon domain-containing protein [Deltaproteobacteria bacterium]|nr:zinc ribbon domain-containing protein [Deltaproteobacteria bacterium]MBW1954450.1 zinc ribbon domain-containing protein [Deltaproteobacteria bacterium]MBW2042512.1 zinc ribbon domain-containing protein [Deltaproteobacteria bacterium]MBW2132333.1 zinc ribbon domain-containing protein [Deltaproteobacteria bacterium]